MKRLAKSIDAFLQGLIDEHRTSRTRGSSVTLEWTMSNLLNNPHVLKKARAELDDQVGQQHLMDEPDLSKLPYLQNIISETLRLYQWLHYSYLTSHLVTAPLGDTIYHVTISYWLTPGPYIGILGCGMMSRVLSPRDSRLMKLERVGEVEMDMTEGTGLTMPKAVPLEAMCKARLIMNSVLLDSVDDI
ncbi:Cytochrome P [Parasponia andersonii]|uniref:Cytochrome P n=1 Tax=Parasponia andersonii TaxID=3476 RepID=A0A2P5BMB7_PARAD|nr:Cytochrome P [Parasponia andersonii]